MEFRPDYRVILATALEQVETLRTEAEKIFNGYRQDQVEYDAAYQIWQDLDKAHGELTRTRQMIESGMI
jgi:hypothetical protein